MDEVYPDLHHQAHQVRVRECSDCWCIVTLLVHMELAVEIEQSCGRCTFLQVRCSQLCRFSSCVCVCVVWGVGGGGCLFMVLRVFSCEYLGHVYHTGGFQ